MAVQYDANGIALTDERGIALPDPYGNLGVLPPAEDGMETVDVYQMQSQVAPELAEGLRLQDVYGTAAMPMYEFVKPVKTGTRTFSTVPDFGGVTFEGEEAPFGTAGNTDFNTSSQKEAARRMQQAAVGELGSMVGGNIGRFMLGSPLVAATGNAAEIAARDPMNFGKALTAGTRASFGGKVKAPVFEGPQVGYGYGAGRAIGGLLAGESVGDAAKGGVKAGVGAAIGNMILPGVGGFIGGAIGGRVICNELQRQGVMSRQNVLLDYRFTRDYLTPQHVNGYHVWAVHVVKQMRKGRGVKLWRHLAQHRANEIAYIYGKRDKPDYLGKIYRKILEPICWSVGFFCQKTDWSVLYKAKET